MKTLGFPSGRAGRRSRQRPPVPGEQRRHPRLLRRGACSVSPRWTRAAGLDGDLAGARVRRPERAHHHASPPPSWASGPRRTSTASPRPHCGCTPRSTRPGADRSGTSPAAWPPSTPPSAGLAPTRRRRGRRGRSVPTQTYRTPFIIPSLPITMGIAPPAAVPASDGARSTPFGSQVCYSPAVAGVDLPLCPSVTEEAAAPPFNGIGAPQQVHAPGPGHRPALDERDGPGDGHRRPGLRPGPGSVRSGERHVDAERRQHPHPGQRARRRWARSGPSRTRALRIPPGDGGHRPLADHPTSGSPVEVVSKPVDLAAAIIVWPGFTRDDRWLVSYQGVLPGFTQRRSVLGLSRTDRSTRPSRRPRSPPWTGPCPQRPTG